MRHSLYWDDFSQRLAETVTCIKAGQPVPVRRVAVFVTQACNFRCSYCNMPNKPRTMSKATFEQIVDSYPDAIIHITGGEPSVVGWLYPYIIERGWERRFHLNTNAYIMPPARHIQRLKVSLDSCDAGYWDQLVGEPGAFKEVVKNIKTASRQTVTSITYTLTRENYWDAIKFASFARNEFPDLYAVFFSVYKGTNPRFAFRQRDIDDFFGYVLPPLQEGLNDESRALLNETLNEKLRLIEGVRFPDNNIDNPCYLSMSERVYGPNGVESNCSHLYRDGIIGTGSKKCDKCQYGCNQRLVQFNNLAESFLTRP